MPEVSGESIVSGGGPGGQTADATIAAMKISVIIPVFNEIATIGEIVQRVRAAPSTGHSS